MSQTTMPPPPPSNQQYCRSCGQTISALAPNCPHCGAPTGVRNVPADASPRFRLVALLLCWFLGIFGAHRFYVGKIGTGILMIFTLGGLWIWWLVDFIMIICGAFKDKEGRRVVVWVD
jgi:TM2 domain